MIDKEMLDAISELLDKKLDEKLEEKLEEKLAEKLEQKLEQKLNQKFDEKLAPIYERLDRVEADVKDLKQTTSDLSEDMRYVKVVLLENDVIPRLNTIESCYVETSKRYLERAEQIDTMQSDIDILKSTAEKHSEILQKIS